MAAKRWAVGGTWEEFTVRRRWDGYSWIRMGGWRWDGTSWVELWPPPSTAGVPIPANLIFNLDEAVTALAEPLVFNLTQDPQTT